MSDRIFHIEIDFSYSLADIIESLNGADSLDLSDQSLEMLPNFKFGWITSESDVKPDCAIIISELLCFNLKAKSVFQHFSWPLRLVDIEIGTDKFAVVPSIPILKGCLNFRKSKITRFSDGDIMEVTSPVMLPNEYPCLFRIEEMPSAIFCNDDFKTALNANSLTGLSFEETPMKSKSWFY